LLTEQQLLQRDQQGVPVADHDPCPWVDPGPDGANLRLEDFPSFQFMRVANAMQRSAARAYQEHFGLTNAQWRLLARLSLSGPMNFGTLCQSAGLDRGHVSRSLRALEEREMVRLTPDPDHGRRVTVGITRPGRALVKRVMSVARQSQMQWLDPLDDQERRCLHAVLRKLRLVLDDREPETDIDADRLDTPSALAEV
jgi:DNA-binding MarR family transcriptional regulator